LKVAWYNRKFQKGRRDAVVTESNMYFIGKRPVGSGDPKKKNKKIVQGTPLESFVELQCDVNEIEKFSLSKFQDGYVLLFLRNRDKPILIQLELKTEFCWAVNKALRKKANKSLHLTFETQFNIKVEAKGFFQKKGWKEVKPRIVEFRQQHGKGSV
jgi:hypothetical protein